MTTEPSESIIVRVDPDLEDLIPGFLENRRNDVSLILEALDEDDLETVRSLGHGMKGAGGGYGFDAITDMGAVLEKAAQRKDMSAIRECVAELSSYLDRVRTVSE